MTTTRHDLTHDQVIIANTVQCPNSGTGRARAWAVEGGTACGDCTGLEAGLDRRAAAAYQQWWDFGTISS